MNSFYFWIIFSGSLFALFVFGLYHAHFLFALRVSLGAASIACLFWSVYYLGKISAQPSYDK